VIYVGKAADLKKRVANYFQKSAHAPRTALMISQIAGGEATVTRTEAEALLVENNLIKSLAPRYNVVFRDDKSYGYILITGTSIRRFASIAGAHTKGNRYFGPFPSAWSIRETIGHLQRIFKLRTCDDTVFSHRSRPCLLHQIHRCSGPCVNLISRDEYARHVEHAAQFLEGHESDVTAELTAKMQAASDALRYEEAGEYRDQLRMLSRITSEQAVESTKASDVDIVVAIEREGTWCVTLAMVRGGRHLGDRSFFPAERFGERAPARSVEAFLTQHYAAQVVPGRVVCDQIEDPDGMEILLATLAGAAVKFVSRPIGEARTWLDMARRNASLALGQRPFRARPRRRRASRRLQNSSGADTPLGRIECFDVSHTAARRPSASCVVYDRGAMQSSGVPALQHHRHRAWRRLWRHAPGPRAALSQARRWRRQGARFDSHRRRIGSGERRALRACGSRFPHAAPYRCLEGRGAQARPRAAHLRRRRDATPASTRSSGAAPHPAGPRRSAPLRDHGTSRAPRQGAHGLAPGGDLSHRAPTAPEAARAFRRIAGRARRERRRSRPRRRHQP
jgi:excinuclease UvrABC nuclease subunit